MITSPSPRALAPFAFACCAALMCAPTAHADAPDDAPEWVRETAHRIHVADRAGLLTLEVEREVRNADTAVHRVDLDVFLPEAASLHEFEVELIDASGQSDLRPATLVSRTEAIAHNARIGAHNRGLADPLALDYDGEQAAVVRNLEVPARGTALVRYAVLAPCNWIDGGCQLDIPGRAWRDGQPDPEARSVDITGATAVERQPSEPAAADARTWHTVRPVRAEGPDPDTPVALRLASIPIDTTTAAAGLEIDVAGQISTLPIAPRYAFVVDLSRSMGEARLQAQLDAIDAILAHTPDATADVVLFDRDARRLVGELVSPEHLAGALAQARRRGELDLAHGSMLERALPIAADVLAGQPGRVIVMTDRRMREVWDTDAALEHLRAIHDDTVVHLVDPTPEGDDLARDDDDDLARLALEHGGMCVDLDVPENHDDAQAIALSLVRPTRLDALEIEVWSGDETGEVYFPAPDALTEGDGVATLRQLWGGDDRLPPALPGRVVVRASIWSERHEWTVEPDAGFGNALAARGVVSGTISLDAKQTTQLATRVGFASWETSFVVREPDRRALTWEMEHRGGGVGFGSGSCGTRCGLTCAAARVKPRIQLLGEAYDACVATHGLHDRPKVTVWFETTGPEIVDIRATAGDPSLATCMEEAGWNAEVPEAVATNWRHDWSESWPSESPDGATLDEESLPRSDAGSDELIIL